LVAAITITPLAPETLAREADVAVIDYDRLTIEGPGADVYVSFDNVEVGRMQAREVFKVQPKGNYVFNAATIFWAQGMSMPPGHMLPWAHWNHPHGPDPRVQQIALNLLRRAGCRP